MPLDSTFTVPTGHRAFLASLMAWLKVNIPGTGAGPAKFQYSFLQQLDPSVMPRVEVNEFKYFDPGEVAFGGNIFPAATGAQQKLGTETRCMVEFNIYTSQKQDESAKQNMLLIRDALIYGLRHSGVPNADMSVPLPPIEILDPANGNFDTGIVARVLTEENNCFIKNYYPPSAENPQTHRYQILAKFGWYEMRA